MTPTPTPALPVGAHQGRAHQEVGYTSACRPPGPTQILPKDRRMMNVCVVGAKPGARHALVYPTPWCTLPWCAPAGGAGVGVGVTPRAPIPNWGTGYDVVSTIAEKEGPCTVLSPGGLTAPLGG